MGRANVKTGELPEIRLLGELAVLRAGKPLPLPASKKTRALLGYLVATGRPHGRERLCDLLWEGPDDPRGALRWSLSKLRQLVDDPQHERILGDRDHASFSASGASVDLEEVKALQAKGLDTASAPALEAVAAKWRGHFLEGLDLPGCVQFYAWCVAEREQARALHVAVLDALILRLQSTPERALGHARALVALDPLAESSHAKVIRLLVALGKPREALAEYDRCRRTLAEQMGARPSDELEQLRADLQPRRLEPDLPPAAPPQPAEEGQERSALVGRTREQQAIAAMLARAGVHAAPNVLLLVGESGLGKSRLLEHLSQLGSARGATVLSARAFEAEGVRPYGLWIDALRAVPKAQLAAEPSLKTLFPDLGTPPAIADRTRLFEAVRAVLARLAPAVVVLDDLQWMDEGSAALLHFLARELAAQKVTLGCGARAGALGDNPAALAVVRALERERRVSRLVLEPLDDAQTETLARQLCPSVNSAQVVSSAEGNPLYALELTRALMRGDENPGAELYRLARHRLDALSDSEQAVLPWSAALGRQFDVEVLSTVSGLAAGSLLDGLERLERHGVLRARGSDGYDFSHDLLRQAAYALMSEPRRRLVHRQISTALQAMGDALAGDVSQHAALAGDHELAATASVEAGRRCWRLCAWADAHEVARRGLDHAAQLPAVTRLPLEVELLGLMRNVRDAVQRQHVDSQFARMAKEAAELGLPALAAQAYHYRSLALFYGGDLEGAHRYSGLVARLGAGNEQTLLRGARCLAVLERDMAQVKANLAGLTERQLPEEALLDYRWTWGMVHRFEGDHARAAVDLGGAAALAARHELHWERALVLLLLGFNHFEAGCSAEALECATGLSEVAQRLGDGVEGPAAQALAALVGARSGADWQALDAALAAVTRADGKAVLAATANFAAELAEQRGDVARALALARTAHAAATAVNLTSQQVLARAILARSMISGAPGDAAAEVQALRRECKGAPSARALAAADAVFRVWKSPPTKG